MRCPHCGGTIPGNMIAKELGSKGGKKSKRVLTHEQSMKMIEAREAKRKKRKEKAEERKKGK